MSEEEIKECLNSLYYQDDVCSISYDKLKDYIIKLKTQLQHKENIIKEVREYIENHKKMTQGSFNGKEWIEQYFELVCNPKELLEILDKGETKNEKTI